MCAPQNLNAKILALFATERVALQEVQDGGLADVGVLLVDN